MLVIKGGVGEYDDAVTEAEEDAEVREERAAEDAQQVQVLPPDSALQYVKNALHEVLFSVDARYLGRNALQVLGTANM